MSLPTASIPSGPRTLAILDHRRECPVGYGEWFLDRGWEVRTARDLEASRTLLEGEGIAAALVFPLTLKPNTLEWQVLGELLSPVRRTPWLAVPWEDAPDRAMDRLLTTREGLADWVRASSSAGEAGSRLENLLRVAGILEASQSRAETLEGQLIRDHKTSLFNDRHFRARLNEEFERSARHKSPLCLVLLDLDDFKGVNDTTSYEFGDLVLRTMAEVLRKSIRSIDIPARIGGDEFAVLLPATTLEEGVAVGSRIRALAERTQASDASHSARLSVSVGVAGFGGMGLEEPSAFFLQANQALKAAKRGGKNRLSFFDPRGEEKESSRSDGEGKVESGEGEADPGASAADDRGI